LTSERVLKGLTARGGTRRAGDAAARSILSAARRAPAEGRGSHKLGENYLEYVHKDQLQRHVIEGL